MTVETHWDKKWQPAIRPPFFITADDLPTKLSVQLRIFRTPAQGLRLIRFDKTLQNQNARIWARHVRYVLLCVSEDTEI